MEVLILAMTKMLSGVCTAGMTTDPDPTTGLRWVRPVKEHDTLLLGDMTTADAYVIQPSDVVDLNLKAARPNPPHTEDWVTDFIFRRPRLLRRLEGERRAAFFAKYLDSAPLEVLEEQQRSLCLIRPDHVTASFQHSANSGRHRMRLGFALGDYRCDQVPVTDIKWRALGRSWLTRGGELTLDHEALMERLAADELYLALGLSRGYQNKMWLMVIGVHLVPDYSAPIDYDQL